jgi:hypothetical protein
MVATINMDLELDTGARLQASLAHLYTNSLVIGPETFRNRRVLVDTAGGVLDRPENGGEGMELA